MDKREKVIKGLECCLIPSDKRDCDLCPIGFGEGCALKLKRDALALLKAQEAVVGLTEGYSPIVSNSETKYYQCEICLQLIDIGDNYCRHCGRKVKWE